MLINFREPLAHLIRSQRIQVDHHDAARALGDVAAVAVGQDVVIEARRPAQPERRGLLRCHDEAGTVQLHAGAGNQVVRHQRLDRRDVCADFQVGDNLSGLLA